MSVLLSVLWIACVIATYQLARYKGRNRFGWTLAAFFLPVIALVVLAVTPRRIELDDQGYHPDYKRLA